MPQFNALQISTIVTLVEQFCGTENERRALIDTLFTGVTNKLAIDISGTSLEFTGRLVFRLLDYGEIASNKPALWALLESIHSQVGVDKQTQIDGLKNAVFDASVPDADYMVATEGGRSIFMSYSRRDAALVERLRADLQASGFNLWIDRKGLKVGQKNWEREIRKALANADCVVYVGSPPAADSNYVGAEIAIAEEEQKPIFSVWAEGEAWSDSAPLSLVKAQYVDLRGAAYITGFAELTASLGGVETTATYVPPVTPITPPPPTDFVPTNPYKGLRPFEAADRTRFFGRQTFITELLAHLRDEPRFLAVIGASGSGKSSVMMAGLLPRLSDGDAVPGSGDWRILNPFKPGKMPLENLTNQLGIYLPQLLPNDIRRELDHESARGLLRLTRRITTSRLVLYIDQFEELFTLTESDNERRQFIDLITTAALEADSPVSILLTMRADFYDRPLAYGELGDLISRHTVPILPMNIIELFDAVRQPAALPTARLSFENGLVEELVFAVNDEVGALPLLQFTLDLLFERRSGLQLTWNSYRALGGVRGALANYAESVFSGLADDGKRLAQVLFLRLIEPGATEQEIARRRATRSELAYADAAQTESMQEVIRTFVEARLLTQDRFGDTETIEVSHEALIREWARLKEWIKEQSADIVLMKSVAASAEEWNRRARPVDMLYRGTRLLEAQDWSRRSKPSQLESAFVGASETHSARLRQQRWAIILVILALALAIPTILLGLSAQQSERETAFLSTQVALGELRNNDARSIALAASAREAMQRDQVEALALAVAANSIPNPPAFAQRVLAEAAYVPGPLHLVDNIGGNSYDVALSPDGRTMLVSSENRVSFNWWNIETGEIIRTITVPSNEVGEIAFSPDGRRAFITALYDRIIVYDLETGSIIRTVFTRANYGDIVPSPDGETLLAGGLPPV